MKQINVLCIYGETEETRKGKNDFSLSLHILSGNFKTHSCLQLIKAELEAELCEAGQGTAPIL